MDVTKSDLFIEYQQSGILNKKLLESYPSIIKDLSSELDRFKKELEAKHGEIGLWVGYQLLKYRIVSGVNYFFIRFQDGDGYYSVQAQVIRPLERSH
jgi:hypothetical protein